MQNERVLSLSFLCNMKSALHPLLGISGKVSRRMLNLFRHQAFSGILLLAAALFSLLLGNGAWGGAYRMGWEEKWHGISLKESINEGLMSLFFLLVGIEIKAALTYGELSRFRQALLPLIAAAGGMAVPALLYLMLTHGTPYATGWPIATATDIGFVVGVMALMGPRIPNAFRVFMLTLAVADDVGAVVVLALGFNRGIDAFWLTAAVLMLCALLLLARKPHARGWMWLMGGIGLWIGLHHAGLHPTLAGVVLAFCMPATGRGASTSKQFEHALNKPVAFLVLPLFVLANTAIALENSHWPWPPFALAIVLALVPGKAIGIIGTAWISLKLKWTMLPEGTSMRTLAAGSLLGGIGFTLSIFFCDLSLKAAPIQENAKLAVLAGSAIAALSGCLALVLATHRKN